MVGFVLSYLLGYLLPALISSASGANSYALMQELGQYAMILIWVLGVIIIPNYFFYMGINTQSDTAPMLNVIISILMILFTILFLYKGNYIITGLASILEGGLLLGIYWVGILTVIGFGFIVTPIATIIQSMHKGQ